MSARRRPEDILSALVRDARAQETPELDWQGMEARLLAKLPEQEPARAELPWRLWCGVALAGAAAYGAFAILSQRAAPPTLAQSAPPQPAATVAQIVNGDALALSTVVDSGEEGRSVEHAGRARWTLGPHSSAALAERGEHLTVSLNSGSLTAQVTPSQKPETFAVEVGGTRFAVHGTAFRVERTGDHVVLQVSEGVVAVEPVGVRDNAEFLLRAGSSGEFALDGRTGKVAGNASIVSQGPASAHSVPRVAAKPHAASPNPSQAPPAAAPSSAPSALPAQLSIADVEAGVSSAVAVVERCFRSETNANGIGVVVQTGMTLHVTGEGDIDNVSFGPALAPSVEACAVQGLRTLSFARSVEGASFTRILELSH